MKNFIKIFLVIVIFCFNPLNADSSQSWYDKATTYTSDKLHDMTTEDMTFKSFYKESSVINWIGVAIFAIVAAATVFFTGGTSSPIVVSIGTWIGGTMGLSGIAATNAGLALLGGGSIASGGLGIVGGTALLTAAVSYSTDIVFDYTVGNAISSYRYSQFAEQSKNMMTLPLPKNSKGSDSYEDAMEILENIDEDLRLSNEANQLIIKKAISAVNVSREELDKDELAKNESLLALLYFIANDYDNAKKHAAKSISLSVEVETRYTLPAFIYATSSLYDEKVSFNHVTDKYFEYSIIEEADNPIISLLLSIYLDRMMYRFNDDYLKPEALSKVFEVASAESIKDKRVQNYTIVLARYIIRLKLEQQKIFSLTTTDNETIKNSIKTLVVSKQSLENYIALVDGAQNIIDAFPILENNEDNQESIEKISSFSKLVADYKNDTSRLEGLINDLQTYQSSLSDKVEDLTSDKPDDKNQWVIFVAIGLILFLLLVLVFRKNKKGE